MLSRSHSSSYHRVVQTAGLTHPHINGHQQASDVFGIALFDDVALADSAPGDLAEQFDPAAQQPLLQLLGPANRLEQVERRPGDVCR